MFNNRNKSEQSKTHPKIKYQIPLPSKQPNVEELLKILFPDTGKQQIIKKDTESSAIKITNESLQQLAYGLVGHHFDKEKGAIHTRIFKVILNIATQIKNNQTYFSAFMVFTKQYINALCLINATQDFYNDCCSFINQLEASHNIDSETLKEIHFALKTLQRRSFQSNSNNKQIKVNLSDIKKKFQCISMTSTYREIAYDIKSIDMRAFLQVSCPIEKTNTLTFLFNEYTNWVKHELESSIKNCDERKMKTEAFINIATILIELKDYHGGFSLAVALECYATDKSVGLSKVNKQFSPDKNYKTLRPLMWHPEGIPPLPIITKDTDKLLLLPWFDRLTKIGEMCIKLQSQYMNTQHTLSEIRKRRRHSMPPVRQLAATRPIGGSFSRESKNTHPHSFHTTQVAKKIPVIPTLDFNGVSPTSPHIKIKRRHSDPLSSRKIEKSGEPSINHSHKFIK